MELVDTHCHLHFDNYQDTDRLIDDAKQVGVTKLITVGIDLKDSYRAIELAAQYDNVWAAAGAHPHEATEFLKDPKSAEDLGTLLTRPKVVAIGEVGLDYYKDRSPRMDQKKAFRQQLEVGLSTNLPFIFHVRDAWDDFFEIIDSVKNLRGVVHSFSSDTTQLEGALQRGFYVGLNGIMTFTKDNLQLEAAKIVPADKLLLETDAPFLAPAPFRGTTCEPKHVATVAEFLAKLRGDELEDLAEFTTRNAVELFGLEPGNA